MSDGDKTRREVIQGMGLLGAVAAVGASGVAQGGRGLPEGVERLTGDVVAPQWHTGPHFPDPVAALSEGPVYVYDWFERVAVGRSIGAGAPEVHRVHADVPCSVGGGVGSLALSRGVGHRILIPLHPMGSYEQMASSVGDVCDTGEEMDISVRGEITGKVMWVTLSPIDDRSRVHHAIAWVPGGTGVDDLELTLPLGALRHGVVMRGDVLASGAKDALVGRGVSGLV